MIRRCLILLTAAVSGILLCACASGPAYTEFAGTDSGKTLTMKPGDRFSVTLESNPTTGYQWGFAAPYDERVLVLCGDTYINPSEQLVGAPGHQKLTFEAAGPGRTGVRLAYRRPWEKGAAPIKVFHLLVMVKGDAASSGEGEDVRTPRIGSKGEVVPESKGLLD